ncbi:MULTISPECIES: lipopolysaccharide biosynthesis protein [Flavobacterium]|uniref:lipopolysaccharide biosynthesis protein n=1 Tax=Flavobacterium TaxID=237 RepID=UPI001181F315|nr:MULTISPECIES: polysaccharide biosynthesis protein [Flavobacterium]MCR4031237.1 polysaccharide biosynthesis protein [Flavobacterium panacis]
MKDILIKFKDHPKYDTIVSWGKLISITGSAQVIVQGVGFFSGILIIRLLSVHEYAFYTLANTMLGAMSVLSDGGISTGVLAQGGKVWENKKELGKVLVTGLEMRKKFAAVSLFVSLPILLYLLLHNGAGWMTSVLIVLSIIPAFYATLSDSLLEIPLKLNQSILPLQRNQIIVGFGRLFMVASTIFLFPFAYLSILTSGIARIYGNIRLKKHTNVYADTSETEDPVIKKEITLIVKKSLPGLIYYCFSGQISTWIISIFGNPASIAQIGALGRISSIITLLMVVFSILIVPRFARIQNQPQKLLRYYTKILIGITILLFFIVVCTYLFSDQILWILGSNYKKLNIELVLLISGTAITTIMAAALQLALSRGWVLKYYISISGSLLPIILSCFLFNISTLEGILYLNILVALVQMLVHVSYGYYKILELNKNHKS